MGKTNKSRSAASKISLAAALGASSTAQSACKSSILRSLFCPSQFQLSLFASVIQGLDSQHLRIHDTSTGRLRFPEHPVTPKATISCLDWGYYGENHRDRQHPEWKRKRKRSERVNGSRLDDPAGDVVVAFGTSESKIHMYSVTEGKIVGVLEGGHTQGIRDFKFTDSGISGEGWSIGGDGKAVRWNLRKGKAIRSMIAPKSANALRPLGSSAICASHEAYIIDPDSTENRLSFAASTNPVRSIVTSKSRASDPSSFLTAAEYDHFINVFEVDSGNSIGLLRTENEVITVTLYLEARSDERVLVNGNASNQSLHPEEVLAAVTKDGALEIFPSPFIFGGSSNSKESGSTKSRMMQRTRKAAAQIRVTRPENSATIVPLIGAEFDGDYLAMACIEGGVNPIFYRERWRNEVTRNLLFTGTKEIVKARSGTGMGAVVMNGVKDMGKSHVDESRTVVANGGEVEDLPMTSGGKEIIDISSGVEESDTDEEMLPVPVVPGTKTVDADVEMRDTEHLDDDDAVAGGQELQRTEEAEEPSFGDIIRGNAPDPVDVQATYEDPDAQALAPVGERNLGLPSGMTLSTVLTQSLRTNDVNLLETCFHERNLQTVRATIERLDSSLAAVLVEKLAERLYSRPGRAGRMMVWIQWTAVAHGGYIAGQPKVMKKLTELRRVVDDRANSLQPLLKLKGKLDMLEAQMNLRKSMQARSKPGNSIDEDDEEGVTYVEGQEESVSEDEKDTKSLAVFKPTNRAADAQDENNDQSESKDEDDEDDMPATTNGVIDESEDESSGSEEVGFLGDEASSTDQESGDEASEDNVDHNDIDSDGSDLSSEPEEAPSAKRPKKAKQINGLGIRRR